MKGHSQKMWRRFRINWCFVNISHENNTIAKQGKVYQLVKLWSLAGIANGGESSYKCEFLGDVDKVTHSYNTAYPNMRLLEFGNNRCIDIRRVNAELSILSLIGRSTRNIDFLIHRQSKEIKLENGNLVFYTSNSFRECDSSGRPVGNWVNRHDQP